VSGPDAEDFLQRMVSNDVAANDFCDALLLTPKARIIAPLRVRRRAQDDFLLLTEPELGEIVRAQLTRARFAAKVEIESEQHESWLVLGGDEVLDERPAGDEASEEDVERWRIESRIPRWGHELDDSILPAEAGLEETHISFSKGCYPGQEPIARQHYRGKVNRRLRVLEIAGGAQAGRPHHQHREWCRPWICTDRGSRRRATYGGCGTRESAPGMIRTCDLSLRRAALYPLSYGRSEDEPV
jgi:folate-binding protein YgfZ